MLHALFNAMRRGLFNAAPFLIQRGTLFIATRHATSLLTQPRQANGKHYSRFIATRHATSLLTQPRLANGKRYSLSPTRFTTPSTSEASGRAASSNRPSGESSSRRGVCNFSIPSICNSWVRSALLLRQYSPCRPYR